MTVVRILERFAHYQTVDRRPQNGKPKGTGGQWTEESHRKVHENHEKGSGGDSPVLQSVKLICHRDLWHTPYDRATVPEGI